MVAREERGLAQLLDGDLGRSNVRIPETEVDDVFARAPQLEFQPLDLGEGIGREGIDSSELRHAADRSKAPRPSRPPTPSPIATRAGVGAVAAAAPIEPRGATTTSSSSVVPRETTAAGGGAGLTSTRHPPASRPPHPL